jgi:hypothetical protein
MKALSVTDQNGAPDPIHPALNVPARTSFRLAWGRVRIEADTEISPLGLVAVGAMVGMILLAAVPVVTAAGQALRRR